MITRTIELFASKREFRFTDGVKEVRFRPIVFLAPGKKKILSVGEAPPEASDGEEIAIFEDADADALRLLEAVIRYGLRSLSSRIAVRPIVLKISIGADVRTQLKGFAWHIFEHASLHAGATKVIE